MKNVFHFISRNMMLPSVFLGLSSGMTAQANSVEVEDACKIFSDKVTRLTRKPSNFERNRDLTNIAMNGNFDDDCNRWQYSILSSLTRYTNYPISAYRTFLFEQLKSVKSYELPSLMPKVLHYTLSETGGPTKAEWQIMLNTMEHMPANFLHKVFRVLPDFELEVYDQKINDIISLAEKGRLGEPSLNKESAIQGIIKSALSKRPLSSAQLYLDYADELLDVNQLTAIISKIYLSAYQPRFKMETISTVMADDVMHFFLDNNDIKTLDSKAQSVLYKMLEPLVKNKKETKEKSYQHIIDLLKHYPVKFASIVESQKIKSVHKNVFLLKYNLPTTNLCTPVECVDLINNGELSVSEQNVYLEYLVAYGSRASDIEIDMVALFETSQIIKNARLRAYRKKALITILGNIKTVNSKAIELLIQSLKDTDYKIPFLAIALLTQIDQPAFLRVKTYFYELDKLSQQRAIETIGKMKSSKGIIKFLKTIPTSKDKRMERVVVDALALQKG